jgi:hypothetical protein
VAKSDVTQSQNVVRGDQAARDVNKNKTIINYGFDASQQTPIAHLIEKFRKERADDKQFHVMVKKLEHFSTQADEEEHLTLAEKLERGGCKSHIEFAEKTKELFAKKLVEFQYFESAQQIHALLLAEVWTRFHRFIRPLILDGADLKAINCSVQADIIQPVQAMLGENDLELYSDEINGMLYFLTGNCHIRWDKC